MHKLQKRTGFIVRAPGAAGFKAHQLDKISGMGTPA
jgi:hypothetical protein